ncbi:MAG TPA: metallophosphoesterase [Solirubrobacteraceae bacterium]|nr:metallophosphoesterase [Solirubrobacteraceae bacterium]
MVRARLLLAALAFAGCGGGGGDDAPPPPAARGKVVWAVGDAATPGDAPRPLARLIARSRVDRLLYLGDVYERGTPAEFRRHYDPLYGRLARRTSPVVGNHEHANRRRGYERYWRRKTGNRPPPWYGTLVGGWELLALDSELPHGPRSEQVRWLRDVLRGSTTCRIAYWHRPRFSAGEVHGDQPDTAPLWSALRGRAVAVVSGHDHNLQRLRPVDGIVQFVSGAGGRDLYAVDERDERLAFADDERFGALRLVLRPGSADWSFVADDGGVLDRGTLRCER